MKKRHRRKPYEMWRDQLLDDIFESARDVWHFSMSDLTEHSGLASATVYRYRDRKVVHPRLQTVFKLCRAVGMDIEIVKEDLALLRVPKHRKAG